MSVFVMLGRYGDVCNILPMLKAEADAGNRPTLVIAKEFEAILDGVSYCGRLVWPDRNDYLPQCLKWLATARGITDPIVCQTHRHPTEHHRKLTESYQSECWRLAGKHQRDFVARGPLVFDRRNPDREERLVRHTVSVTEKPLLLVGLDSVSSPLRDRAQSLMLALRHAFADTHQILDLSTIRAERIYDLLGLYDRAACLVAADTLHLHLSRASKAPLVALVNNGWYGSIVEHASEAIRYADISLPKVIGAVARVLSPVHA